MGWENPDSSGQGTWDGTQVLCHQNSLPFVESLHNSAVDWNVKSGFLRKKC